MTCIEQMTCGLWNVTAWQNGDFQLLDIFSFYYFHSPVSV